MELLRSEPQLFHDPSIQSVDGFPDPQEEKVKELFEGLNIARTLNQGRAQSVTKQVRVSNADKAEGPKSIHVFGQRYTNAVAPQNVREFDNAIFHL